MSMEGTQADNINLTVSEEEEILADIKLYRQEWQVQNDLGSTLKDFDDSLVKKIAKEWLDEGRQIFDYSSGFAPGRELLENLRKDKTGKTLLFPRNRNKLLDYAEKLFRKDIDNSTQTVKKFSDLDDEYESSEPEDLPDMDDILQSCATSSDVRNKNEGIATTTHKTDYGQGQIHPATSSAITSSTTKRPMITSTNGPQEHPDTILQAPGPADCNIALTNAPPAEWETYANDSISAREKSTARLPTDKHNRIRFVDSTTIGEPSILDNVSQSTPPAINASSTRRGKRKANEPPQPKATPATKKYRVQKARNKKTVPTKEATLHTTSTNVSSEPLSSNVSPQNQAVFQERQHEPTEDPRSPKVPAPSARPSVPRMVETSRSPLSSGVPAGPSYTPAMVESTRATTDDRDHFTQDSIFGTEEAEFSNYRSGLSGATRNSVPSKMSSSREIPSVFSTPTLIWILKSSHPRLSWRRWDDLADQPLRSSSVAGFFATVRKCTGIMDLETVKVEIRMGMEEWLFKLAWGRGQDFQDLKTFMLDQAQAELEEGCVSIYVRPYEVMKV